MINPTTDDLGRKVIYHSPGGDKVEEGVITSFNEKFVFVRYGANTTSAATLRDDLKWVVVLSKQLKKQLNIGLPKSNSLIQVIEYLCKKIYELEERIQELEDK